MGGSVLAFDMSAASSWQLAVTAEGLREETAPGRAVASVLTSLLSAATTALLLVTHFTVPVKLLATVLDVAADAWVVVVELLVDALVEHPAIAAAEITTASTAIRFILFIPFIWVTIEVPQGGMTAPLGDPIRNEKTSMN